MAKKAKRSNFPIVTLPGSMARQASTWKPRMQQETVTVEAYATLRMYIDMGCASLDAYRQARDEGCKVIKDGGDGCWYDPPPGVGPMAEAIYRYIPKDLISLEPAQAFAKQYFEDEPAYYPSTDAARLGWPTFADREQLLAALDAVTAPEVRAELGSLDRPPDAAGQLGELASATAGGLEWWMIALAAGGVLAWLGRRTLVGLVVGALPKGALATVGRWLFRAAAIAGTITAITYLGKQTIENVSSAVGSLVPIVAGVVLVVGVGLYLSTRKSRRFVEAA